MIFKSFWIFAYVWRKLFISCEFSQNTVFRVKHFTVFFSSGRKTANLTNFSQFLAINHATFVFEVEKYFFLCFCILANYCRWTESPREISLESTVRHGLSQQSLHESIAVVVGKVQYLSIPRTVSQLFSERANWPWSKIMNQLEFRTFFWCHQFCLMTYLISFVRFKDCMTTPFVVCGITNWI